MAGGWRFRGGPGLLAGLLVLAGLPPASGEAPSWEHFRSEAGRFAVDLPAAPALSRSGHDTLVGRVESVEYLVQVGALELRVETHDLPFVARLFVTDRGLLRRAGEDLVEDEAGATDRLLEASESQRGGHPARTLRYRLPPEDGRHARALLVLLAGRLYVLVALHPRGAETSPDVARFFTSFEPWERR